MQRQTNDSKSLSGRREFLKSAGGAAAGVYLAGADPLASAQEPVNPVKRETLAINGGPKAVTTPLDTFRRWPIFGEEEEKEIVKYFETPTISSGPTDRSWNSRRRGRNSPSPPTARPTPAALPH